MKGFLYGQSEYYLLNSANKIKDYVAMAKENSFDFLTITDNNLYGSYKFYKECKKNNIKPIIGLEYSFIYEIDNRYSKVIIYAKNNQGFKDLSYIESMVKINNINDLSILKKNDNLIYIFVFNDSFIERSFLANSPSIDNDLSIIKELNGFIGLSYTNDYNKYDINLNLESYCKTNHIKTINIHQCLYLEKKDRVIYETLNKINEHEYDKISDFSFLTNPEFDYSIDKLINEINVDIFDNKFNLPQFKNTKGVSSKEYLEALAHKGLEKRGLYFKEYISRLEYELSIIDKMGFNDYLLIVWDYIRYSKTNNILVGPGRGSAAGSLVAYSLGITDIDPLKFGLLFERFLNPERVSMPDIDTDFPTNKRDLVVDYVKKTYGNERVYTINAFDRFREKSAINSLRDIFKIEKNRSLEILDMIKEYGYDVLLEETKYDKLTNDFIYVLKNIDDLPKSVSQHAPGIIITSVDLFGYIPLQKGNTDTIKVEYDKDDVEELGLLKMDFLGVTNLNLISEMIFQIEELDFNKLRNIKINDSKTFELLREGDTLGIFQLEGEGITNVIKKLGPTKFSDIVALLALYRPGPMDNIPDYIERCHGKKFEYIHKDMIPILKETYGIIVYQEQIMQIAKKFAGYSLGEADLLRRAISKKDSTKLDSLKNDFINRCIKNGYSQDIAIKIYDLIYKFADYGFNKSHSVVYSMFSYQMAYLKANYYKIFSMTMLNHLVGSSIETNKYMNSLKSKGINILKPNINYSMNKYIDNNDVLMPLNSIFSISENVALDIIGERNNGLFIDFNDFIKRCKFLNKNQIEALIFSGALDIFNISKKQMLKRASQNTIFFSNMENVIIDNSEFDYNYLKEQELKYLGLNIEYNIYKNYSKIALKLNTMPLNALENNKKYRILCAITDIKEINTKANKKMAILTISNEIFNMKAILFPDQYLRLNNYLKKDELLLMFGNTKENDKKEIEFVIDDIKNNI